LYKALLKRGKYNNNIHEPIYVRVDDVLGKQRKGGKLYNEVKVACEELLKLVIQMERMNEGTKRKKFTGFPLMSMCEYEEGAALVKAKFNPEISPYLFEAIPPYVRGEFVYLDNLTFEAERLYMMIKECVDYKDRILTKAELQEKWKMQDQYERFTDFTKRVIKPAVEQILLKTELSFKWKPVKKAGEYYAYHFTEITLKPLMPFVMGEHPPAMSDRLPGIEEVEAQPSTDHSHWMELLAKVGEVGVKDPESLERIRRNVEDPLNPHFDEGYIAFVIQKGKEVQAKSKLKKTLEDYVYTYVVEGYHLSDYIKSKKRKKAPVPKVPAASATAPLFNSSAIPTSPSETKVISKPFCSDQEMREGFEKAKREGRASEPSLEDFIIKLSPPNGKMVLGALNSKPYWFIEYNG
jgi:hypothetical protein